MSQKNSTEKTVKRNVTYSLFKDGKFYIVENVPARVNTETGEEFFSPATVESLHNIILGKKTPVRTVQTPIFDFS
ncbi:MAG: hypothetical protein HQ525_09725 [Anaerolineae bacterium]|uniref:YgiT-type zinc finger protein n=1 Tax=Candidatus Desulfolinea nitratireducens TaxID=2841698 RepID=A0A8J6TF96_9CHLR|nr:hypothetical protein [Candidatus Desulfolinea nitratireducens]MBL6959794.1 hypothetical protein [Anaerolineales bacterium]NQU30931.1 hypothetical protein [Anaerolineae bacterium]